MEVIEEGTTPSNWRKDVICPHCHSKLKICWKDIFIEIQTKETFFSYKKIIQYQIECPVCKEVILLDSKEIPNTIKEAIYYNIDLADLLLLSYFS